MSSEEAGADAILLCAGFGTRMYPLTQDTPKSLLQVAGKPVLDYLLLQLCECRGLRSIHIVTNNKFYEQFVRWQLEWERTLGQAGLKIHLYNNGVEDNDSRLGAFGDLAYVLERADLYRKDVLVSAGDNIFLFDLQPVWQKFIKTRRNLLLAVSEPDQKRLRKMGVLEIGEEDRVVGFVEKSEHPPSSWVCPAFYCLTAGALALVRQYMETSESKDAIGYFIQYLVARAELYAFCSDGRRLDIGSLEDYAEANTLLANKDALPD